MRPILQPTLSLGGLLATIIVLASAGGLALAQSAPGAPDASKPVETRYTPMFNAIRDKLASKDWELQEKSMSAREISQAMGDALDKEGKAVIASMTEGQALGGNNYMTKQMMVVMALRFKDADNAKKFLEMSHNVSKTRFGEMGKKMPGMTMEIKEEDLMVKGVNASRRLVVKTEGGPRAGTSTINRFTKNDLFVEIMVVSKDDKNPIDIAVTDEAVGAAGRL